MDEMTGKGQTLAEHYKGLQREIPPKKKFIAEASTRCGVEPVTVESWINGRSKPSKPEYFDILSEMTGIPQDQLFANDSHAEC
jgi:hypothetical protein